LQRILWLLLLQFPQLLLVLRPAPPSPCVLSSPWQGDAKIHNSSSCRSQQHQQWQQQQQQQQPCLRAAFSGDEGAKMGTTKMVWHGVKCLLRLPCCHRRCRCTGGGALLWQNTSPHHQQQQQ